MKLLPIVTAAALGAAAMSARAQAPAGQPNMQDAMKALGALMAANTNAAAVVDFRELKALLPAELPGFKRTNAKGEKNSAMGMTIAQAEGQYEGDKGASVRIKIVDMGGTGALGGFAGMAIAAAEVDNESDDGYERTTTIDGHKALEKYNTKDKSGELQLWVGQRFQVEIDGNDIPAETLKKAAAAIDLKKLSALKAGTPGGGAGPGK